VLTREAVALYMAKLREDGLLAFNVTNEYFDLARVIAAVAADRGLPGLVWEDRAVGPRELLEGKDASAWVVLARRAAVLAPLRGEPRWVELAPPAGARAWTDDRSSVLGALRH